ncbi:MAG: 50S ribosomal protein L28 [Rickettsiales bacterium]|nr:50S ribosomal protein L28 [Rickettsiales bacterium]
MSRRCELLGVSVMSGNKISHSNRKTRRRFLPNLKTVSFKSDVLGVDLTLKVTAASIRTVNKYGNIDNFLINYRNAKLTESAKKIRLKIKRKLIKLGKFEEVKIVKEKKTKKVNLKEASAS